MAEFFFLWLEFSIINSNLEWTLVKVLGKSKKQQPSHSCRRDSDCVTFGQSLFLEEMKIQSCLAITAHWNFFNIFSSYKHNGQIIWEMSYFLPNLQNIHPCVNYNMINCLVLFVNPYFSLLFLKNFQNIVFIIFKKCLTSWLGLAKRDIWGLGSPHWRIILAKA